MTKMIVFLKRKPDLTAEEFRKRYESGHAELAKRLFGDIFAEYSRNYITEFVLTPTLSDDTATSSFEYDVFAEVVFRCRGDFEEWARRCGVPAIKAELVKDEQALFDRDSILTFLCDTVKD